MARPSPFDVVLFDMGGVLVRLTGVGSMQELAGLGSEAEVWEKWLACDWVRAFERGLCTPEEFASGLVGDWGLPITAAAFLDRFRAWPIGLYDGAAELVAEVRRVARVGCVSNSNFLHWAAQEAWKVPEMLDVVFLSHQIGLIKPDRDLFEHVAQALKVPAERVLFLDDNEINVVAARSVGFAAATVVGPEEGRAALIDHGVLEP